MKKKFWLVVLGVLIVTGCAKQSPLAPQESKQGGTVKTQSLYPDDYQYDGSFGGYPGVKPWNWKDSDDEAGFNATIRTCPNAQSAYVTRINDGSTWGKVCTFEITPDQNYSQVRIFVPSHSSSVTWKLVAQELGGSWRNWVIQSSTGQTGYLEYDISGVLNQNIDGAYQLEIVVEGGVGEYIEVAELWVYNPNPTSSAFSYYWAEHFGVNTPLAEGAHTAGWFDATTNPEFNCTITNIIHRQGLITPLQTGGKVVGPVIPWKTAKCTTLTIAGASSNPDDFAIVIQEQTGEYRRFVMNKTYHVRTGTMEYSFWTVDMTTITSMTDGTPFSVAIEGVQTSMVIYYITLN